MYDFFDETTRDFGSLFAGRDYSAPTAESPPLSTPEDAGPLGFLGSVGQTLGDLGRGLSQEGISGLLDPVGMLDRQDAQRDLMERFDIRDPEQLVSEPGGGDYAGNQVSPEEFQEIAKTYSDIRLGRSNIEFDTAGMTPEDAERFRDGTMSDMADILQTDSGRELIADVAHGEQADGSHRTLTLGQAASPDAAAVSATDPAHNADRGNGVGADSTLRYVPGEDLEVPGAVDPWWPVRSDVVLYHELVHASHNMAGTRESGTVDPTAVPPVDVGVNNAEYQAMGLGDHAGDRTTENRYRAERRALAGKRGERAGDGDPRMVDATTYNPSF